MQIGGRSLPTNPGPVGLTGHLLSMAMAKAQEDPQEHTMPEHLDTELTAVTPIHMPLTTGSHRLTPKSGAHEIHRCGGWGRAGPSPTMPAVTQPHYEMSGHSHVL